MTEYEREFEAQYITRDEIVSILHGKLGETNSAFKGPLGKERAGYFLDLAFEVAKKLKCRIEIVGSVANGTARKNSDMDIVLIPEESDTPKKLTARLKKYLNKLKSKTTFKGGVNKEAEREYCAFDLGLDGHIALVSPVESLINGATASMRMVAMSTTYPWKGLGGATYEENATVRDTIIDFGFAVYEDKRWLKPEEFDPTQKFVIKMVDKNTFVSTKTSSKFNPEIIHKLSKKSQAILMLRSYAAGIPIPDVDLKSFNAVTAELEYVYIYNICPSLGKVERSIGIKALTDPKFVEKVLKFVSPYMYVVLKSFNLDNKQLEKLFKEINGEFTMNDNNQFLRVLSLAAQHQISAQNPTSGEARKEAEKFGKTVEYGLYSYNVNRAAFMHIFTNMLA